MTKKKNTNILVYGVVADGFFQGWHSTKYRATENAEAALSNGANEVKIITKAHVSSKKRRVVEKMLACMEYLYPNDMLGDSEELTTLTEMCEKAFDYYVQRMTAAGGNSPFEYEDD